MSNTSLHRVLAVALVGTSEAARRLRSAIEDVAARRTPVLLACEPGCRPREIAEFVHVHGGTADPFVTLDCSSADATAIDRALFGAPVLRPLPADLEVLGADSLMLAATGGTLFIESIDELPAAAQRRLARILRDREARTASRHDAVSVTCRVIASSSPDIANDVRNGRFRQDLYRRLSGDRIPVPPLRQRAEDLAAIIDALMPSVSENARHTWSFTQPAITVLAALHWTNNIDELAELLQRILQHAGPVVRQEDVLTQLPMDGAFTRLDLTASLREARYRFEREYIAAVLERCQWRMVDAAKALGIERANLYRKTRQLGITRAARVEGH